MIITETEIEEIRKKHTLVQNRRPGAGAAARDLATKHTWRLLEAVGGMAHELIEARRDVEHAAKVADIAHEGARRAREERDQLQLTVDRLQSELREARDRAFAAERRYPRGAS